MNVLVTGAAGFIGSHFAEEIASQGYNVIGIDNFSNYYSQELKLENARQLESKNIRIIKFDLCNDNLKEILNEEIHYIFHFAGQPGISADSTFESYQSNNFIATYNLLNFAQKQKELKLFINLSTSSVYGRYATLAENEETKPVSDYGVTKLAAEQLVLAKSRSNLLRSCSLRLFSVYGPRERPDKLFTKLIDCALYDKKFPLFEGSEKHIRSFTYVADIVNGILSVIGKEDICDGEIFNIGTESEHTTQEGIDIIERITNKPIKIQHLPKRPGDQLRTSANINKARKLLNYEPRTSFYQGLENQTEWFKNNL
ncbi:NAD-dependent epimerase/dehydratase family protein [Christiangramia echinicola]|uniref:Nucleoside-diphosphate-sugar epimerase n=1 Tax=Christiangramia echinicola TaxID=279359 RepID=A0A1H1RE03_9FLAO|nr:NAD-dependent epimerase/dehydratase family protein [Christiangramia echinicola]SDS33928.1 Nucleoside-diphosphate-sugar epimerase [Christiangramia echinicola]